MVSSGSLSDFPLLLTQATLPSEMFDSDGSYPAQSDGGDIRFSSDSAGSTQLSCEVVEITTDANPANGTAEIWVKVPSVTASGNTTIYIWYNTAGTTTKEGDGTTYGRDAVWAGAQIALLMEDVTPVDHTGNHTITVTNSGLAATSGPFGAALSFGSLDRLSESDAAIRDILTTHDTTVEVIAKRASYSDGSSNGAVLSWEGIDDFVLYPIENSGSATNGVRAFWRDLGGSLLAANNVSATATWEWTAVTTRGATDHEIYNDGTSVDTSASSGTAGPFTAFYVGSFGPSGQPFLGDIAHVVVWKTARSDIWIASEHANQSAPATYITAGTPADGGGGGGATYFTHRPLLLTGVGA